MKLLTLLIILIADGEVVLQTVDLDATVCFKTIDNPQTTCFVETEVIYHDGEIIGRKTEVVEYELVGEEYE